MEVRGSATFGSQTLDWCSPHPALPKFTPIPALRNSEFGSMSPVLSLCLVLWPSSSSDSGYLSLGYLHALGFPLALPPALAAPIPAPLASNQHALPPPQKIGSFKRSSRLRSVLSRRRWLLLPVHQGPLCPGGQGPLQADPADPGRLVSHDSPTHFRHWHHITLRLWPWPAVDFHPRTPPFRPSLPVGPPTHTPHKEHFLLGSLVRAPQIS